MSYLKSDSDSDHPVVNIIRLKVKGNKPRCVKLEIQVVPVYGIMDSGAYITIMGGDMFKKVVHKLLN